MKHIIDLIIKTTAILFGLSPTIISEILLIKVNELFGLLNFALLITIPICLWICSISEEWCEREEKHDIKSFDDLDNRLKALEIIKKKKVNLEYLKCCETYEQYKTICSYWNEIIEWEFGLLKEVLL